MRTIAEALDQRVLLSDGSAVRLLRAHKLDLQRDFYGAEDCFDVLCLTRTRLVRRAHIAFLEAGADVIRTNTLEASPLSLRPHGLGEEAFYINYSAAQIACEAVDSVRGRGRRRFVLGVVRDQGWTEAPKALEGAVATQVEGLLAGGVDGIALDLTPGTGRTPVFLRGARRAKEHLGARAPIFLQRVPGDLDFSEHARALADGIIRFRQGQTGRFDWLKNAIRAEQVNLVGGGATPEDTARLDRFLRTLADDGLRPLTQWYQKRFGEESAPASSTLYAELEPAIAGGAECRPKKVSA